MAPKGEGKAIDRWLRDAGAARLQIEARAPGGRRHDHRGLSRPEPQGPGRQSKVVATDAARLQAARLDRRPGSPRANRHNADAGAGDAGSVNAPPGRRGTESMPTTLSMPRRNDRACLRCRRDVSI